jgi:cation-transporting ATPase E
MLVIVFVEPPVKWLAVIEPLSPDWRPARLAVTLTGALVVVMLVPPFRDFFNLYPMSLRDVGLVLGGLVAWTVLVWIFWRWRFIERFLGAGSEGW